MTTLSEACAHVAGADVTGAWQGWPNGRNVLEIKVSRCHVPGGEADREGPRGIRPEHLELAGDGVAHLRAQVIEQLGADTLIHGHFGSDRTDLTVRLRGTVNLKPDETLPLRVAPEHLHLFDPAGGARLGHA